MRFLRPLLAAASALLLLVLATPGALAHEAWCSGGPVEGGACLIVCGLTHAVTSGPHDCRYDPSTPRCVYAPIPPEWTSEGVGVCL